MNIILIVIDTLRYDYVRSSGVLEWLHTPNMDRLAARSLSFDHAYTASYPTIPHRTDLITGQYGDPFHPWQPLRFDVETLPRLLETQAGYCTQLIHSTPHLVNGGHAFDFAFNAWTFVNGAEVDRPWIDDRPFTYLENWADDPLFDPLGEPGCAKVREHVMVTYTRANRRRSRPEDWSTGRLFSTGCRFLQDNRRRDNFFLWLDCFDPHPPYDAPPEMVRLYDRTPGYDGRVDPRSFLLPGVCRDRIGAMPAAVARIRATYAGMVSWVDLWLGKLLDTLEETGLAGRTAIVFTADHGTCMGEFDCLNKRPAGALGDLESRVPLMVAMPGGPVGRSDRIVQPQDIFRTILELARVQVPDPCDGHDALDAEFTGKGGPRDVALTGSSLNEWRDEPEQLLFTAYDREWYLNFAAKTSACRLFHYGAVRYEEDASRTHPQVVAALREKAIEELRRRRLPEPLVTWLRSEGTAPFPSQAARARKLPGWETYWNRIYNRWA